MSAPRESLPGEDAAVLRAMENQGREQREKVIRQMAEFLGDWFREGQSPIHPGTLVNDSETFDELVAKFIHVVR